MTTENVDPSSLSLHPLLKLMPAPDSELLTSVANDIAERGIDDALIVDEKNRVMSGRIRLKAALAIELPEVPVRRASSADAATIIVQSLLQRQHFSKSALAYLAFPFFQNVLEESRHRRIENLKQGPDSTLSVLSGRSAEDVARQIGVSRVLFFHAKRVHELLRKHPALKEAVEEKILSGALDLDGAIHSITGAASTKGQSRADSDQLELFKNVFHLATVRFSTRWGKLKAAEQQHVLAQYTAEFLPSLPPEFHRAYQRFLKTQKQEARS